MEKTSLLLGALRFPFIGTRKGGDPFEYLLMDINEEKANISIFKWMVNHTPLTLDEEVDLYLPLSFTAGYEIKNNVSGKIQSIKEEEAAQEFHYTVAFNDKFSALFKYSKPLEIFIQTIQAKNHLIEVLFHLLKDSMILKQSLLVYLNHFAPYFSRILKHSPEEYQTLKDFIFTDVMKRVQENIKLLTILYGLLKDRIQVMDDISIYLNLEDLRETMESEISLDLFLIAFTSKATGQDIVNILNQPEKYTTDYMNYRYIVYLLAIKNLEKRLYFNYNQIVLIYMKSII